jgi:hypothetical protein
MQAKTVDGEKLERARVHVSIKVKGHLRLAPESRPATPTEYETRPWVRRGKIVNMSSVQYYRDISILGVMSASFPTFTVAMSR